MLHSNTDPNQNIYSTRSIINDFFCRRHFVLVVGSVPDMLYFTKDCQTIVVVNEGEYDETDVPGVFIDPEGTVSIIRLDSGSSEGYTINHLNFTAFNERYQ